MPTKAAGRADRRLGGLAGADDQRMTPASPHTKPAIATAVGLLIGILTLVEGFFGSGHIPTSAEVGAVLAGSGVSLGSIIAFVLHHLGVTKAQVAHDTDLVRAEWVKAEPLLPTVESTVPGLQQQIADLTASTEKRYHDLVASLPAPVQIDIADLAAKVKDAIVAGAVKPAGPPTTDAPPAGSPG